MPVHVTVQERLSTTTLTATTELNTFSSSRQPVTHTSVLAYEEHTTVHAGSRSASIHLLTLIIPLSLLIIIVMAALILCFILTRNKRTNEQPSAAEDEVTYSAVRHVRHTFNKDQAQHEDVIYSTLAEH
uniref:uncharacterized protein n=1 Tax=Semicossyphus pulcher TaxID=241346 RepID=UPI0037E7F658